MLSRFVAPRVGLLLPALFVCALRAEAEDPQQILKRAIEEQNSGHFDQAVADYQTLIAAYPNIAPIRSNLGAAFAAQGKYADAIEQYKIALKLAPNTQVQLNLALAFYKEGDMAAAIENLQQVHGAEPQNTQATTLLADCYLRIGKNQQVIDLLTPIQEAHPDDRTYEYLLGTALVRDGQIGRGQVIIDRILRNGNSAEAHLLLGTAKMQASDFAGARDEFQTAVELNDKLPDAYAYYGLALLRTGDQAGAKDAFRRELESDPNDFQSNLSLGALLRNDEDYDNALKYLNAALRIRPGDPGVRYQIAAIELSQGKVEDSQRDLEALLKDSPNFLEAHVSLATVYFREHRKADGERERAIFAKLNAEAQKHAEIATQPQAPKQ